MQAIINVDNAFTSLIYNANNNPYLITFACLFFLVCTFILFKFLKG